MSEQRQSLINEVERQFDVRLLHYARRSPPSCRPDATVHSLHCASDISDVGEPIRRQIRSFIENRGWQFARWVGDIKYRVEGVEHVMARDREVFYLAPQIRVGLDAGYHVTPQVNVTSIMSRGLLPSIDERKNFDRTDCDGNIYLCERLGTAQDEMIAGRQTAYWWRKHLSERSFKRDIAWAILCVNLASVPDAIAYRDMFSESGIVVRNVERIPPDVIAVVFEG